MRRQHPEHTFSIEVSKLRQSAVKSKIEVHNANFIAARVEPKAKKQSPDAIPMDISSFTLITRTVYSLTTVYGTLFALCRGVTAAIGPGTLDRVQNLLQRLDLYCCGPFLKSELQWIDFGGWVIAQFEPPDVTLVRYSAEVFL
ncbi:hypothetical protein PC128_g10170 [Phytophthora cactorum]|nr:hypothetical protein PC128_g10170 [Phytophthora cactorum]